MKAKAAITVGLVISVIFLCAFDFGKTGPEKTVEKYFTCIQKSDFEGLEQYIYQDETMDTELSTDDLSEDQSEDSEIDLTQGFFSILFEYMSNIEYEILDSNTEDDSAEVTVELTYTDLGDPTVAALQDYLATALILMFADEDALDDERQLELFSTAFEEELKDYTFPTVTETFIIECKKESDQWKLIQTEELENAVFCNIILPAEDYMYGEDIEDDFEEEYEEETEEGVEDEETVVPVSVISDDDYILDELGWIEDKEKVEEGLEDFFDKTGVKPFVYLKEYDQSLTSESEKADYASNWFNGNIDNEYTFLWVYFAEEDPDKAAYMYCISGSEIKDIMNDETIDTFWDCIDECWTWELPKDDMLIEIFNSLAEKMNNTYYVGDTIYSDNGMIYTITDAGRYKDDLGDDYVYVELDIENQSGSDEWISKSDVDFYADDYPMETGSPDTEDQFIQQKITNGRKAKGRFYAECPDYDNISSIEAEIDSEIIVLKDSDISLNEEIEDKMTESIEEIYTENEENSETNTEEDTETNTEEDTETDTEEETLPAFDEDTLQDTTEEPESESETTESSEESSLLILYVDDLPDDTIELEPEVVPEEDNSQNETESRQIDYLTIYTPVLSSMSIGDSSAVYSVCDMNSDGVYELLVGYTSGTDYENDVWTIEDDEAVYVGDIYLQQTFYTAPDYNGIYGVYVHMGYQTVTRYTLEYGSVVEELVEEEDLNFAGADWESYIYSNEMPLSSYGIFDTSGLENISNVAFNAETITSSEPDWDSLDDTSWYNEFYDYWNQKVEDVWELPQRYDVDSTELSADEMQAVKDFASDYLDDDNNYSDASYLSIYNDIIRIEQEYSTNPGTAVYYLTCISETHLVDVSYLRSYNYTPYDYLLMFETAYNSDHG